MKNTEKDLWFPDVRNDSNVEMRLFCFPFAGGNSFTYRIWKNRLPAWINVCPAQLPGRAMRIAEPCFTDLHQLTAVVLEKIRPYLDRPFAIFGYSMGAIIGFELARTLERESLVPECLFVAASRPPQMALREPVIYGLSMDEFKAALLKLNGTPAEILENEELFELMLPLLRADFELVETYRFTAGAPLKSPIFAFGGRADDEVSEEDLGHWREQTVSSFDRTMFDGDHFFINTKFEDILNQVERTLVAGRSGK